MASQKPPHHGLKKTIKFLFRVFMSFLQDGCIDQAAAIAYYITFSLPPLLVLIVLLTSIFIDPGHIQNQIYQQLQNFIGEQGARQVLTIINNARQPRMDNAFIIIISFVGLFFSATGTFLSIQNALNNAWEVMPAPKGTLVIKDFFLKRLLSLGLILLIILVLLFSMALSGLMQAFGNLLSRILPHNYTIWLLFGINWIITAIIMTLLFAVMYKYLPDAHVHWLDIWPGAIFGAVLFVIVKDIFAFYIGKANPGNAFGAAGSMVVILLWLFLTGIILLLGAEFTQQWSKLRHKTIIPVKGAVRFKKEPIKENTK